MLPELTEIKKKRKEFGFTQTQLSQKTGISQSLIAKIEKAEIIPSYKNAKKIFDFFESIEREHEAKANEFMTKKLISIGPESNVREAIRKMEKNSVSQLPVIEDGKNIGNITEKSILEKLNKTDKPENFLKTFIREIMEDALPQITEETPFDLVSSMLEHSPCIIVMKNGKITGIISKSDLLKSVISKRKNTI